MVSATGKSVLAKTSHSSTIASVLWLMNALRFMWRT